MKTEDTIIVLTSKALQTMVLEGGCGHWRANETSIRRCKYIVATRNKRSTWVEGPEPHGTAFLIGEVSGAIPIQDRYIVQMSRYAEINIADIWQSGGSNPVRYVNMYDLGIELSKVEWKKWPEQVEVTSTAASKTRPLTLLEAKKGLALTFGVEEDAIEITIRG
jgi:hypothetical protein